MKDIAQRWGEFLESKEYREIMRIAPQIGATGLDEHGCRKELLFQCAVRDAFMAGAGAIKCTDRNMKGWRKQWLEHRS